MAEVGNFEGRSISSFHAEFKEGQQSLHFDGANVSYLTCDSDNAMSSPTGGIAFWMKADEIVADDHDIIELYDSSFTDFLLIRIKDNQKIYVRIEDEDVGLVDVYGSTSIQEDQWYHIAVVQDGNSLAIYVDGVLDGIEMDGVPETWTDHLDISNHHLRIGAGHWGGFKGYFDDIRITNTPMSPGYIYGLANEE